MGNNGPMIKDNNMKLTTEGKIRVGYIGAFILLFIAYLFIYFTTIQMNKQSKWINHTNQVITQLELLASNIKDAETGVRGYIIMKDNNFLEPYYSGIRQIPKIAADIKELTIDNKLEQQRLDTLNTLINERLGTLERTIIIFRSAGYELPDSVKKGSYRSKQVMDDIRNMIRKMNELETNLLLDRVAEQKSFTNAIKVLNITAVIIAFLLALYSIITFSIESAEKNKYRTELENKIKDLSLANTELIHLKSLEKFTSTGRIARTIAHEVRNPLTNIGLAAEQLKEASSKSEETTLYLNMIKRNSDRINV